MMNGAPARVLALLYHEVTDDVTTSGFQTRISPDYAHTPTAFAAHLDAIAAAGHAPRRLDPAGPASQVVLTFDDGGRSASLSADLLEERGWRGYFFICTGCIGDPAFLSPAGIRDLHDRGHVVGAHSHTHPNVFRRLTAAAMDEEWRRSREVLEDIVGQRVETASVPGGESSAAVVDSAARANFAVLFDSEPTYALRRRGGVLCVGRLGPLGGRALLDCRRYVAFGSLRQERTLRTSKALAKRALGPIYRRLRTAEKPQARGE